MAFFVTAGKDIFPLTINRSRYVQEDSCFNRQASTQSCPTWYNFGKVRGPKPSELPLNEFGVFAQSPPDNGPLKYFNIFFGRRNKGEQYTGYIEFGRTLNNEKTILDNSILKMTHDLKLNFEYNGLLEFFKMHKKFGVEDYFLKFERGKLESQVISGRSKGYLALDPWYAQFYAYAYDPAGASYATVDGTWPHCAAGYNVSHFGANLSSGSAIAVVGGTGNRFFGYKLYSFNIYFEFGIDPSKDELLWSLGHNAGNYISFYVNRYEASFWTYDNQGTNLLWNSKSSGVFQLYQSSGSQLMLTVRPDNQESAIWSRDSAGNNLLWNSNKNGIFQLWGDSTGAYMAFYIKNQSGFWFTEPFYTDLKFSNRLGLLQVWSTSRNAYIDLSVYMLEWGHVATFNYVYCKGKLLKSNLDNRYIKILSTHPIDICDPTSMGYIDSPPNRNKHPTPECVLEYEA
jgi:hypothetical protein